MSMTAWFDPRRMPVVEWPDPQEVARWHAMTPAQRTLAGLRMHRFARLITTSKVRSLHPDWDDAAVRADVSRRMLDGSV